MDSRAGLGHRLSLGPGLGATNNTITNVNISCGVDQSVATLETFGIISSGATIGTTNDGTDNDNNTFSNNNITKARWGIFLRGNATNSNDNNVVSGNLIGPAAFGTDQMGRGGIVIQQQNAAAILQNEVRFVGILITQTATGSDKVGIGIGGLDGPNPTTTNVTGTLVQRNKVHDIINEKATSALGIVLASAGAPSGNLVVNNFIYNVRANGTGSEQCIGIDVAAGNGDSFLYNSIAMTG